MKKIDKQSSNKQSDDTLIYILLFLLAALLIGGGIWWWIESNRPKKQTWTFTDKDYEKSLGNFEVSPDAKTTLSLIQSNRDRLKTVKRILRGKMKGRSLTSGEKEELWKELKQIDSEFDKLVRKHDLKELEKNNPDVLANIYRQAYEQGKIIYRLKAKTSVRRSYEEIVEQKRFQDEEWEISETEEEEVKVKMHELIIKWYDQAKEELLKPEQILTEHFEPVLIEGKPASKGNSKDMEYFKQRGKIWQNWEEFVTDFSRPFEIKFEGYGGFITPKDAENSEESKETYGLTISDKGGPKGWTIGDEKEKTDWVIYKGFPNNRRKIVIKLRKDFLLNRLGYEEWLTDIEGEKDNPSRFYYDICFEAVVETIAHELAHAIINTEKVSYDGEEGGGHGDLFYDYLKKIKKMIKRSAEFEGFKQWWNLTKN